MTARVAGATALLVALAVAAPADARGARPNLHELRVGAPATTPTGGSFTAVDVVRNDGRVTARRSSVGYFLSRDRRLGRDDVRLGARSVAALRARRSSRGRKGLRVPALAANGSWRLLACADPPRRVRETSERDNCAVAPRALVLGVAGPTAPVRPAVNSAPTLDLTISPAAPDGDNGWYRTMPTVHAVADDVDLDALACAADGAPTSLAPTAGTTHGAEGDVPVGGDGSHQVSCTATDGAGNATTSQIAFKVDRAAPFVALTNPAAGAVTTLMSFDGTVGSDGDGPVTLDVWNGSDASGTPARSQSAPASGGAWALTLDPVLTDGATYTAQARQTDAAGNVGVTAARTFTVPLTIQAAGDIARCGGLGDEATGALVRTLAGTVATLGDNVYDDHVNPEGSLANFVNCFEPTWGPLKPRTRPAAGNHEYNADPAASGYFDYFNGIGNSDGPAGPRGKGYYSYEKGAWHIVVLNTNNNCAASLVSCGAGSPQETWLRADLAAHPGECTLAYFHHPRFASALYNGTTAGSNPRVKPLWDALYDYGAELVLNGHAHNYERYRPVDPAGTPDSPYGIREIISGEGGASHPLYSGTHDDNSEAFDSSTFGVVEVRLGPGGYSWHYTPAPGTGPFAGDSGSGACHAAPPPSP